MMATEYTAEEQRFMDRITFKGELPQPKPKEEPQPHPLAGRTPGVRSTSRKALKGIKPTLGLKQRQVLTALQFHDKPLCDLELLDYLNASTVDKWKINMVNGRRHDLLEMGLIKEAGRWPCSKTRNRVIHWRVKPEAAL